MKEIETILNLIPHHVDVAPTPMNDDGYDFHEVEITVKGDTKYFMIDIDTRRREWVSELEVIGGVDNSVILTMTHLFGGSDDPHGDGSVLNWKVKDTTIQLRSSDGLISIWREFT